MSKSSKGAAWEREFCKLLSIWWTDGRDDDLFWRTSQSGGRATTRRKKGKTTRGHVGDICATDAAGEPLVSYVSFELKRGYNRHTLHDLIDKPAKAAEQEYEKWVAQAKQAKKLSGARTWVIVTRRDRRDPLIVCPARTLEFFGIQSRAAVSLKSRHYLGVAKLQDLWEADPRPVRTFLESEHALKLLGELGPGPS